MTRYRMLLPAVLLTALLTGCTASSKISDHEFSESETTVYISYIYRAAETRYIFEVLAVLENHGFVITPYDPYASYVLVFRIDGRNVDIILKQGHDAVIQVEAHESYWVPNEIIANVPLSVIVDHAVEKFDEALTRLVSD